MHKSLIKIFQVVKNRSGSYIYIFYYKA